MKITFHGKVEIEPAIDGHSTITTKVSGCIYDTERAFYDLWEEIGDERLKQLLKSEGFDVVDSNAAPDLLESCIKLLSELGVDAETADINNGYSHIVTDALNAIKKAKGDSANPSVILCDVNISQASFMHNLKKAKMQMNPIIENASIVSKQFCPKCSPDTWSSYKFANYPPRTKCGECGYIVVFDNEIPNVKMESVNESEHEARIADEKTAEVYFCTHCMAFNEEDCCCSENDE